MATSTADIITAAGTSKGGLYNHFKSKEQLFLGALSLARKIWREQNLAGMQENVRPIDKIKRILDNYKDRYLVDSNNFPGGCIFVNLIVELSDQHPHLAAEIYEGFDRFKAMLNRFLEQAKSAGTMRSDVSPDAVVELIFSGLLGACVMYTADKSRHNLDRSIGTLHAYIDSISIDPSAEG